MNTTIRHFYFDLARAMACFLVIINHTYNEIFYNSFTTSTWLMSALFFFSSKIAVPIFVMISGALLLEKQESYPELFKKRILKILSLLIIWSIIVTTFNQSHIPRIPELLDLFWSILSKPVVIYYWYLYMLLGIYLILPLIRSMISNFSQKEYLYLLILWAIFTGTIPLINLFIPLKIYGSFKVQIATGYIGYYILGYYLHNFEFKKAHIISSFSCFSIGILLNTICTYYLSLPTEQTTELLDDILLLPIIMMSASAFVILKYYGNKLNKKMPDKIISLITSISQASLGIYLIHFMIIEELNILGIYQTIVNNSTNIVTLFFFDTLVFIISYVIVTLLKRIPFIRYIV